MGHQTIPIPYANSGVGTFIGSVATGNLTASSSGNLTQTGGGGDASLVQVAANGLGVWYFQTQSMVIEGVPEVVRRDVFYSSGADTSGFQYQTNVETNYHGTVEWYILISSDNPAWSVRPVNGNCNRTTGAVTWGLAATIIYITNQTTKQNEIDYEAGTSLTVRYIDLIFASGNAYTSFRNLGTTTTGRAVTQEFVVGTSFTPGSNCPKMRCVVNSDGGADFHFDTFDGTFGLQNDTLVFGSGGTIARGPLNVATIPTVGLATLATFTNPQWGGGLNVGVYGTGSGNYGTLLQAGPKGNFSSNPSPLYLQRAGGQLFLGGIATSDPHVVDAVWRIGTALQVSAG